jgi:signal transduction histidine kinase
LNAPATGDGINGMLERARQLSERLKFDPARTGLGWWLALINVVIVLLVVGGISISAIGMLRDLADQQGKARVQLAAAMAREDLRRLGEDAVTAAHVLADRPTLQRLVGEEHPDTLALFLRRFCQTERISACAVFQGSELLAQAGEPLPWSDIVTASTEQGESFLAAPPGTASAVVGAGASFGEGKAARVYIVRDLDAQLARTLSQHVGLAVHLVNYRTFAAAPVDAFTSLHSSGLADGHSAVQRIAGPDLYAASVPVFASTGEAIALIETRLPAAAVDQPANLLARRLKVTALMLAILAVLAGVFLGQMVAAPVRALTQAAVRLGQGDFSTSIPPGGAAEVGTLARTMENMRSNLVELTGTLRRREAEAQAVLSGIVEGVYAVDKNRVIRYLNPQAARLLNVDTDSAVGRFCGDVLKPCDINGRRPCEEDCPILQARTAGSAQLVERLQTSAGGARTTVIASSSMVDGLQVQVIRDETELEAVRRARDTVLANISHEFRTPLAAQLASIELLRDGLSHLSAEQLNELVLSLERGTVRLTQLIDNLLESTRIESGQLSIRHQSVALAEVVEEAHALMGSLLVLRGQNLQVSLPPELPHVEGDATRLTQVFVNLLANASKFAPEGSVIRVGARAADGRVIAWVEDEGAGVPTAASVSIFERFGRGPDEEPEAGGLGLGLWIVKSIIDRHGGTITAERTSENRTRFSIDLPGEALT